MVFRFSILLVLSLFLICFSCEQKVKSENNATDSSKEIESDSEHQLLSLTDKVEEVESLCETDLRENRSLLWEKTGKESPELIQVTTFSDQAGLAYKIIEEYNNGEDQGQEGRRIYYLEDGKVFAYYHQYDKWLDESNAMLFDEQHFYDENSGELILSRKRSSDAIEYLDESEWEEAEQQKPNLELAESILQSKAPFETHFLSTIESEYGLFLLLGEPKEAKEARYQTTVAVNPQEPFIQDLLQNKKKYKFKKLNISYSFEGGGNHPVFTVLQSAEWE